MTHLSYEQRLFVQYQIRNWACGRYEVFRMLNAAWSAHGAVAVFWN